MPITQSTSATSVPKQIAVYSTTDGEVMYTVPSNRTFVGLLTSSTINAKVTVNGELLSVTTAANGTIQNLPELTFIAGTVITKSGSVTVTLVGVESE